VLVVSAYRQFVLEGYLMSYGPDTADIFWRAASYVDRILRGEKALGITVPKSFLQLADEVIE
jgi:putative tryptophan/tyrosine transport system substrate-binding protein